MTITTYRTRCNRFLWSLGIIFLVTALAKAVSALGTARILSAADPVLGLSNRQVMSGVAVVEFALALYLFKGKSLMIKLGLSSWMCGNLLAYRWILASLNVPAPCSCLGTLTDNLPIPPSVVSWTMKALLTYMVLGCLWMGIQGFMLLKSRPSRSAH